MKTKISLSLITIILIESLTASHVLAQPVSATDVPTIPQFETLFSSIVGVIGTIFGFAFFAMMVVGGIKLLMSAGDPKAVAAAKDTITWAIVGLAFLALSYTILLIITAFTGVDVTKFRIGI